MIPYYAAGVVLPISVLALYAGKCDNLRQQNGHAGVRLLCGDPAICVPGNPEIIFTPSMSAEAAGSGRASGGQTGSSFYRIIVPNMLSGILVSGADGSGGNFTDYAARIIAGSRYETAQAVLYNAQKRKPAL